MAIHFLATPGVYTSNTTVAFPATINGVNVTCEISTEALQDHFEPASGTASDLLAAFEMNRATIEITARAKLPIRIPLVRCLLVSNDF